MDLRKTRVYNSCKELVQSFVNELTRLNIIPDREMSAIFWKVVLNSHVHFLNKIFFLQFKYCKNIEIIKYFEVLNVSFCITLQ